MEDTWGGIQLVEKLFDQALKMKLSKLARKIDPSLVFELWTQLAQNGKIKDYFREWKWTPEMTLAEAFGSMDDYLNGLQELLEKRQAKDTESEKSWS